MYTTSTQKQFWTFESDEAISAMRHAANNKFREKFGNGGEEHKQNLLTSEEEQTLCRLVGETAMKFCQSFKPQPLPSSVVWTAFVYFKRFYLRESVMQHYPKNVIMSCLYLACKIDEYNISIDDFVNNLKAGEPSHNRATILSYEPQLLQIMDYQLTVHCPFRPLEGQLIQFKAHMSSSIDFDVEKLRKQLESFLDSALMTDIAIRFPPSQIALATIASVLRKDHAEIFEQFLSRALCPDEDIRNGLLSRIDEMCAIVDDVTPLNSSHSNHLQERVKQCYASITALTNLNETNEDANVADEDDDDL